MKVENQLLARLARAAGITVEAKVEEPVVEAAEAPVDAAEVIAAELTADTIEANVIEAIVATDPVQMAIAEAVAPFAAQVVELSAAIAELTGKYEAASAIAAALTAEKETMLAAAAAAKLAARMSQIEAAVGTEKAAGLMAATEGLEDGQFNLVISALVGTTKAEAESSLFQEVGVSAEADASKIVTESAEMRILKQQYGK